MALNNKVTVVGSFSQDFTVQVSRLPVRGETIRSTGFTTCAGGKGNNQAIAAARAGADVIMVGRVGNDGAGDMLVNTLKRNGVSADYVLYDPDVATGVALITVGADGGNSIVIAQNANLNLCPADVAAARKAIAGSKVVLMQLEVPTETDIAVAKMAQAAGAYVILNPAPAPENGVLPAELLANVDLITPNQTEAQLLTGVEVVDEESAAKAAALLRKMGPKAVVITMGEQGAYVMDETEGLRIYTYNVDVVDTTAAGDAFCGALAADYARHGFLLEAVRYGCAAGALATTKMGAEPSLPTAAEIDAVVQKDDYKL